MPELSLENHKVTINLIVACLGEVITMLRKQPKIIRECLKFILGELKD